MIFSVLDSFLTAMSSLTAEIKKTITVKIQIADDTENVIAVNFPDTFSVENLKEDISKKFLIKTENLLVFQNGEEIRNENLLTELNLNDFGIIEILLKLNDAAIEEHVKLDTSVYYSSFTLPDIITVHVPIEDKNGIFATRDLVVEIENKTIKKPFLGGFVHNKTSKRLWKYSKLFMSLNPILFGLFWH